MASLILTDVFCPYTFARKAQQTVVLVSEKKTLKAQNSPTFATEIERTLAG